MSISRDAANNGVGGQRPNRIGMSESQDLSIFLAAWQIEFADQVASKAPTVHGLDLRKGLDTCRHQVDEPVHGGWIIAGRFAFHHLANERDHLFLF
jgi:hypothetical protein